MTHLLRRVTLGAIAASAAIALTACGGNSSSPEGSGDGGEETTTEQALNTRVTSVPNFVKANDRYEQIEANGCSPDVEEWAHDLVVFTTDVNGGDWEHVQTEFTPTTVAENQKACEIKVTNSGIVGTAGGDLNNYTVTISALSRGNNPANQEALEELGNLKKSKGQNPDLESPEQLANINPLMESAYAFATSHGDPEFNGTYRNDKSAAEGFFHTGDTHLAAYADAPFASADEEPWNEGGAWAAVTTDEPQKDTIRVSGPAAGQIANMWTWNLNNQMRSDTFYNIKDAELF